MLARFQRAGRLLSLVALATLAVCAAGCRQNGPTRERAGPDPSATPPPAPVDASPVAPVPTFDVVGDAAPPWTTSRVKLTWVVYDQSSSTTLQTMRELVVRVGTDVRRFALGTTAAGCGLSPKPGTTPIANPVKVGAPVSVLECYLGGSDDLEVVRIAPGAISITRSMASDGYGAAPPVPAVLESWIPIPTDAVFEDTAVFFDHGKLVDDDAGP